MKHALNAQATAAYSRAVVAELGQMLITKPAMEDIRSDVQICRWEEAVREDGLWLINCYLDIVDFWGVRKLHAAGRRRYDVGR